jgi:tetratricopeptide (TPR) repeat protein
MRVVATAAAIAVLVAGSTPSTRADALPGSARAFEALALCDAAARQPDDAVRSSLLEQGLALAEAAVETDPADAAGHFAVFCTLGRRVQRHPLAWGTPGAVRRARREIDRALELAPGSPELLTAKGIMLLELPRLLGGDPDEGRRLLHRALELAPGFADAEHAIAEYGVPPSARRPSR